MLPPDDGGGGGGGSGTWPDFGGAVRGNALYEASDPPNGYTTGIWLGSAVTPVTCFGDRNTSIVDRDHDLLSDNCEVELAKAFAPHWGMAGDEPCPQAEPYWAVKYFDRTQVVRIAYMPAYYMDCGGNGTGHAGDSEFVMVQVAWNVSTLRRTMKQPSWAFPGIAPRGTTRHR
jgi:hypothetical protein